MATTYGMIHPGSDATLTVRSLFVIDPAHRVRATIVYPPSIGRSFAEVLRILDALQVVDAYGVETSVDWQPGERVLVSPATDDETAIERFGGFDAERPYLRWVDQAREEPR